MGSQTKACRQCMHRHAHTALNVLFGCIGFRVYHVEEFVEEFLEECYMAY